MKFSELARLVAVDAVRIVAGSITRDAEGLPAADGRARLALDLAVDQGAILADAKHGRAQTLGRLTLPAEVTLLHRMSPHHYDLTRATTLWRKPQGQESSGAGAALLRARAPQAVSRHVDFRPYRTTLALAGTIVDEAYWSQRP